MGKGSSGSRSVLTAPAPVRERLRSAINRTRDQNRRLPELAGPDEVRAALERVLDAFERAELEDLAAQPDDQFLFDAIPLEKLEALDGTALPAYRELAAAYEHLNSLLSPYERLRRDLSHRERWTREELVQKRGRIRRKAPEGRYTLPEVWDLASLPDELPIAALPLLSPRGIPCIIYPSLKPKTGYIREHPKTFGELRKLRADGATFETANAIYSSTRDEVKVPADEQHKYVVPRRELAELVAELQVGRFRLRYQVGDEVEVVVGPHRGRRGTVRQIWESDGPYGRYEITAADGLGSIRPSFSSIELRAVIPSPVAAPPPAAP